MAAAPGAPSNDLRTNRSRVRAQPVRNQHFHGLLSQHNHRWPPEESLSGTVPVPDLAGHIERDQRGALGLELTAMPIHPFPHSEGLAEAPPRASFQSSASSSGEDERR